jgi:hypothetical protein
MSTVAQKFIMPTAAQLSELGAMAANMDTMQVSDTNLATNKRDTPEYRTWKRQRLGRINASQFFRINRDKKDPKKWSKGAVTLLLELVTELHKGEAKADISHLEAVKFGIENEPNAIKLYEKRYNCVVEKPGYITLKGHNQIGCTPDGRVVGSNIYLEVKSRFNQDIHDNTKSTHQIPSTNLVQVLGQMLCTGADCIDFVSYIFDEDTLHEEIYVIRLHRHEVAEKLRELRTLLMDYKRTLNNLINQLNLSYPV